MIHIMGMWKYMGCYCCIIAMLITGSWNIISVGEGYSFNSCGQMGRKGPNQYQCNSKYQSSGVQVRVLTEQPYAGFQVWRVPNTTTYSVTALGAGGGAGIQNPEVSRGAYVHAEFNFTEGEEIYILIGQQGSSACSQTNKEKLLPNNICMGNENVTLGGGGGGGGGIFVFKRVPNTTELIPLIIAGGGGGKSTELGSDTIRADGGLSNDMSGNVAVTWSAHGPGGGGGWHGISEYAQSGQSLVKGAIGGKPCINESSAAYWDISGGFGGGGGGCSAGGGGGGYTGGNVSRTNSVDHNGMGGSSYIHPDGVKPRYETGANHSPDGELEISYVVDCPCEFMCIFKDNSYKLYECYCQPNFILAPDGKRCLDPRLIKQEKKLGNAAIIGIIVCTVVLLIAMLMYCGYRKRKHQLKLGTTQQAGIIFVETHNCQLPYQPVKQCCIKETPNYRS